MGELETLKPACLNQKFSPCLHQSKLLKSLRSVINALSLGVQWVGSFDSQRLPALSREGQSGSVFHAFSSSSLSTYFALGSVSSMRTQQDKRQARVISPKNFESSGGNKKSQKQLPNHKCGKVLQEYYPGWGVRWRPGRESLLRK